MKVLSDETCLRVAAANRSSGVGDVAERELDCFTSGFPPDIYGIDDTLVGDMASVSPSSGLSSAIGRISVSGSSIPS